MMRDIFISYLFGYIACPKRNFDPWKLNTPGLQNRPGSILPRSYIDSALAFALIIEYKDPYPTERSLAFTFFHIS